MKARFLPTLIAIGLSAALKAQVPDSVYTPNIYSAKLYLKGNPLAYPLLSLGSNEQMELEFDDLDGDVKNYSYTYQLCNADWTPVQVSTFDYIRGFAENHITDYRHSSLSLIGYTHYHAGLHCSPLLSGHPFHGAK